jgi:hypothetical protein
VKFSYSKFLGQILKESEDILRRLPTIEDQSGVSYFGDWKDIFMLRNIRDSVDVGG